MLTVNDATQIIIALLLPLTLVVQLTNSGN